MAVGQLDAGGLPRPFGGRQLHRRKFRARGKLLYGARLVEVIKYIFPARGQGL
jgi:hypothetical protein